MLIEDLLAEDPVVAARHLADAASRSGGEHWVAALVGELDRLRDREAFDRFADTWGLSNAHAGRIFGVSRQAIAKWRSRGVPEERRAALGDLAAVTDLLTRYVKRDRIPAIVRRPADMLGGATMVDLVAEGRAGDLLEATRAMFDLRRLDAA